MTGIPLGAAIGELRRQVAEAIDEAEGEELRFRLGPIELELQVELEKSGEAKTGFNVWVVSVGAGGKLSSTETHRVMLSLQPHRNGDEDVDVSRRKARRRSSPMNE